jgi:glycosyltransferase involved in cell wall biosynthesis
MTRVMFISTGIPPYPEAQTIRNIHFIRGLVRKGFQVTVLTPEVPDGDDSLTALMPRECEYVRTTPSSHFLRRRRLQNLPFSSRLQWAHGILANLFVIPDFWAGWDRQAIQAAQAARLRPDVIVSSASSQTAHLAAVHLSKLWDVPWVADYGDPWTLNPIWPANAWHRRLRNARLEKAVLPHASAVIFTTAETQADYQKWLGQALPRSLHIPCGYSAEEFDPRPAPAADGPFRITYIGAAFRLSRNLIPAIRAVGNLRRQGKIGPDFELHIVGPHSRAFEDFARTTGVRNVYFSGHVSYAESLRRIVHSHVLLHVGNIGPSQIPGKTYIYLGSGRSIVYICQQNPDSDPAYRILEQFPGVRLAQHSSESIAEAVSEVYGAYDKWRGAAAARQSHPDLARFEWTRLGDQFAAEVSRVIEGMGRGAISDEAVSGIWCTGPGRSG